MLSEDMPKGVAGSEYPEEERSSVSSWIVFLLVILTGIFYAYFHNLYVTGDLSGWKLDMLVQNENALLSGELLDKASVTADGKTAQVLWVKGASAPVPFLIDYPQTVRLRVNAYFPRLAFGPGSLALTINGHDAAVLTPEWNGGFSKFDLVVHKKFFNAGKNTLEFRTSGTSNARLGLEYINLRNYAGISKRFPRALVYYDGNYALRTAFARPFDYLLYPSVLFVLWVLAANLARLERGAVLRETLKRSFYCFVPATTVFFGSFLYSKITSKTIVFGPDTFFIIAVGLLAVYAVYHAVILAWSAVPLLWGSGILSSLFSRIPAFTTGQAERPGVTFAALRFIGRHAATTAVAVFMVCLFAAGLSMILKRQDVAERMADAAYFSLVFGVLLRIFDLRKEE